MLLIKFVLPPQPGHEGNLFSKGEWVSGALMKRLACFAELEQREIDHLEQLCADVREVSEGDDLIAESDNPDQVFIQLEGWAYRYKILPDGQRQITGYLLPGDMCDVFVFILEKMDHGIGALSNVKFAAVTKQDILDIFDNFPKLARALWWSTLVDESILRQWLTNMGQRFAYERVAHIFCELWLRMKIIGEVEDDEFHLPVTQTQLGDTVGLTPVHVSRTLKRMRDQGLIELGKKQLKICNIAELKEIAGFNSDYLHLHQA